MAILFVLISQTRNLTRHKISFRALNGQCPVPNLEPYQTGIIKQNRILRYCRNHGPNWTIGVFSAGEYTGIELTSEDLLIYTRLIFMRARNGRGRNVLRVEGVREKCIDNLLRHRYFGFLRNAIWNRRHPVCIGREDSQVETRLRKLEAPPDQPANLMASTPIGQRSHVNHGKQNSNHVTAKAKKKVATRKHSARTHTHMRTKEQMIPVDDSRSFLLRSYTSEKIQNHVDSFVHGFLFLMPFTIALLAYAFTR